MKERDDGEKKGRRRSARDGDQLIGFAYPDGDLDEVGDAAIYFHYRPCVVTTTIMDHGVQ